MVRPKVSPTEKSESNCQWWRSMADVRLQGTCCSIESRYIVSMGLGVTQSRRSALEHCREPALDHLKMNKDKEKVEVYREEQRWREVGRVKGEPPGWSADEGAWGDVTGSIGNWQKVKASSQP